MGASEEIYKLSRAIEEMLMSNQESKVYKKADLRIKVLNRFMGRLEVLKGCKGSTR